MLIKDFPRLSVMDNWRARIDPFLRTHLEVQVRESIRHRKAYKDSKDPGKAQLWVAIANMSRQLFNVSVKLNYLERLFQEELSNNKSNVKKVKKKK